MTNQPSNTLHVNGMLLSTLTMELLGSETAEFFHLNEERGVLIKVVLAEHDVVDCPSDLREVIEIARTEAKDWVFISKEKPMPQSYYQFMQ